MRRTLVVSTLLSAMIGTVAIGPARANGGFTVTGPHGNTVSGSHWGSGSLYRGGWRGGPCCGGAVAGLAVGTAIGAAAASRPTYVAPPPVVYAPAPVVYAPPPVVYAPPVVAYRAY